MVSVKIGLSVHQRRHFVRRWHARCVRFYRWCRRSDSGGCWQANRKPCLCANAEGSPESDKAILKTKNKSLLENATFSFPSYRIWVLYWQRVEQVAKADKSVASRMPTVARGQRRGKEWAVLGLPSPGLTPEVKPYHIFLGVGNAFSSDECFCRWSRRLLRKLEETYSVRCIEHQPVPKATRRRVQRVQPPHSIAQFHTETPLTRTFTSNSNGRSLAPHSFLLFA